MAAYESAEHQTRQSNELATFLNANGLGDKVLVACEKADWNL